MKKLIPKLILSLISITLTVKLSLWISETFFFDKFYYYKSVTHGYWVPDKKLSWKDFGKRGQDLIALVPPVKNKKSNTGNVLGTSADKAFTIAVIGDSYVWGQGLREQDRFANILEEKLNKIFPSKVISLGNSGDGMIENYIKYKLISDNDEDIDFYIFGVSNNDLILSAQKDNYNKALYEEILAKCPEPYVFEPKYQSELQLNWDNLYTKSLYDSFDNKYGNLCIRKYITPLLPKQNAIYYSYYPINDKYLSKIVETLKENNLTVIYPTQGYIAKYIKKQSDWNVSEKDKHPSRKANLMFANQLYDYILENGYIPK